MPKGAREALGQEDDHVPDTDGRLWPVHPPYEQQLAGMEGGLHRTAVNPDQAEAVEEQARHQSKADQRPVGPLVVRPPVAVQRLPLAGCVVLRAAARRFAARPISAGGPRSGCSPRTRPGPLALRSPGDGLARAAAGVCRRRLNARPRLPRLPALSRPRWPGRGSSPPAASGRRSRRSAFSAPGPRPSPRCR